MSRLGETHKRFEGVITDLQARLQSLQQQYTEFVRSTIEMVKIHKSSISEELKNDPNTPRELIELVIKHGESLQQEVERASAFRIRKSEPGLGIEWLKGQIFMLIDLSDSSRRKKAAQIFCDFEHNFEPTVKSEAYQELIKEVHALKAKLNEKNERFRIVSQQLERIKHLQDASFKNLRSQYYSNSNNAVNTHDLQSDGGLIGPKSHNMSFANHVQEESYDLKGVLYRKLNRLSKLMKKFTSSGIMIQKFSNKEEPEYINLLDSLRLDTEEIERTIEDIVTPRFHGEVTDKKKVSYKSSESQLKHELELMASELKAKTDTIFKINQTIEVQSSKIKKLKSVVLALKSKINQYENEKLTEVLNFEKQINVKSECKVTSSELVETSRHNNSPKFDVKLSGESQESDLRRRASVVSYKTISVLGMYRYDNIIREMRKQLMEKEKELYENKCLLDALKNSEGKEITI